MSGFANIGKIPELQRRIWFTVAMLAVYRVGVHVPIPGIDASALKNLFESGQGIFGIINTFTGGAFERMSVFALGIMPYITASIIFSLLAVVVPYLEQLQKEGEIGRRKITQYTRYLTVVLSAIQGGAIAMWLQSIKSQPPVVPHGGVGFFLLTIITVTAGTAFIMWLGEQITERGIGNGISLIIFAGIVARMPNALGDLLRQVSDGQRNIIEIILLGIFMVAIIAGIIFIERGQRRLPVQYPSRTVGRRQYKGVKTHLPLKVNTAGVIPPIFASSLLAFPASISQYFGATDNAILQFLNNILSPYGWAYNTLYGLLIIFFTFFYTAVQFNPVDVADNLKKHGGYIPGVRPGKNTADHIDKVLTRVTLGGAIYLVAVCVLPSILMGQFQVPFWFGGTSLLIVVGVAMDTAQQIEAHMIARHYDGFLGAKGPRMKGRRR